MRSTTIGIIFFHLLALTLAAPAGKTTPRNEVRDLFDQWGTLLHAVPPNAWAAPRERGKDSIFSGVPPRRPPATSPRSQGGIISKLVKKDIIDWIASLLHIDAPVYPIQASSFYHRSGSIMERMSLLHDPLLEHLRDGADDLGQGFALAKAKLLLRVLVNAVPAFAEKERLIQVEVDDNAIYHPHSLLEIMSKAQGARVDIKGNVTCPDGTQYEQNYVIAGYELANLPEVMDNWPGSFPNTYTSGGKHGQVFTGTSDDLMQSPMVDDYLKSKKPELHSS